MIQVVLCCVLAKWPCCRRVFTAFDNPRGWEWIQSTVSQLLSKTTMMLDFRPLIHLKANIERNLFLLSWEVTCHSLPCVKPA